ncbi:MAG: hypothetical protein ACE15C_10980 [Phycisphaerae bacterium]
MDGIAVPTVVEFESSGINDKHLRAFCYPAMEGDWPAEPLMFSVESRAELADDDGPDYQYSAYLDVHYEDGSTLSDTYLCFAPGRQDHPPDGRILRLSRALRHRLQRVDAAVHRGHQAHRGRRTARRRAIGRRAGR